MGRAARAKRVAKEVNGCVVVRYVDGTVDATAFATHAGAVAFAASFKVKLSPEDLAGIDRIDVLDAAEARALIQRHGHSGSRAGA